MAENSLGTGRKNIELFVAGMIMLGLMASGCASGRTEFKIIKITPLTLIKPTPTPYPEKEPISSTKEPGATVTAAKAVLQPYIVQEGDCLWRICESLLGDPELYPQVAQANNIANPDLIHPGRILQFSGIAASGVSAPVADTLPAATPTVVPVNFPVRQNRAFGPGERLTFSVEYFGIAAGYATLSVAAGPDMHGRPTLHLVATARTHPAFEWFFKVRDRIESFYDAQGLFSWRYEKHVREGSYSTDAYMIYDQVNRKVIKDKGRTVIPAVPWVQDVLSEFYYYRTLGIDRIGETTSFPVVADDGKSYEVQVKTLRYDTVKLPAGEFQCIVVQPLIKFEGVFQQKGKVEIWLTNDHRQVPVLIKSAIIIGTIDIVLRDAVVVDY